MEGKERKWKISLNEMVLKVFKGGGGDFFKIFEEYTPLNCGWKH